jgi:hypothetical protein
VTLLRPSFKSPLASVLSRHLANSDSEFRAKQEKARLNRMFNRAFLNLLSRFQPVELSTDCDLRSDYLTVIVNQPAFGRTLVIAKSTGPPVLRFRVIIRSTRRVGRAF